MTIEPMSIEVDPEFRERRARALAALGDTTRLGVMDLIATRDMSPDSLAKALGVPGNLLAHHLRVLEDVGLIRRTASHHDRRRVYVQAVEGGITSLLPLAGPIEASRVMFVCTHNSARSVLAEAIWRQASGVPVASAGTQPVAAYHPGALAAARRHGYAIVGKRPRALGDVMRPGDMVVSVCDSVFEEVGPVDDRQIHWSVSDPAAAGTKAAFDQAVRELRERVSHLAPRVRRPNARNRRGGA